MDAAFSLTYAPRQRRSFRRRGGAVIAALIVGGVGIFACRQGWQRVMALQSDVQIGPVDWWAVLTSPTLLRTAWALSSNPRTTRGTALEAPAGSIGISVKTPLFYREGKLQFNLEIENRGSAPVVLPPLLVGGKFQERESCRVSPVVVWPGSLLGRGVRVIGRGRRVSVWLDASAGVAPTTSPLVMSLFGHAFEFLIQNRDATTGSQRASWSELSASDIERRTLK